MDGWVWMRRSKHSTEMSFITRQRQKIKKKNLSASMKFITKQRLDTDKELNQNKKLICIIHTSSLKIKKPVTKQKIKVLQLSRS